MSAFPPSPEQTAFRNALLTSSASILLEAVAGSGKTTSIIANLDAIKGEKALIAFNKKIADELGNRLKSTDPMTQMLTKAATAHSFGLDAYRKAGFRCSVNGGKVNFLIKDWFGERDYDDPLVRSKHIIRALISNAKSSAFGVASIDPATVYPAIDDHNAWRDLIEHHDYDLELMHIWGEERIEQAVTEVIRDSITLLKQSNARRSMIDFDDMLYLPLLLSHEFKKYDAVIIDEAQDTNKVRAEMVFRMLKPSGRVIIVGDPHQAIYGFTGADANALSNLQARAKAIKLPLSVCWRCDDQIIAHAQRWVRHITSHNAGSGKGSVREILFDGDFFDMLQPRDAILCRLNKPNVAVAIALLRRGKTPRIEGRDFGQTLLKHVRMAAPDMPPLNEAMLALDDYLAHQTNLLIAKEKHAQADTLTDEVEALQLLIERCLEQGENEYHHLEALANLLFMDDASKGNAIVLSSVHKAKGLEWPRVFLLGRSDYMPFWRAQADWQIEQEHNLIYVAVTRAEHELIEVCGVVEGLKAGVHKLAKRTVSNQAAVGQIAHAFPGLPPALDLSKLKI